ncbi:uncharacterized protein DS421_5g157840 [Arachis hypogaea]|nr:uncharacterized protein DS421_5g157840 [Arachis hypogaea]
MLTPLSLFPFFFTWLRPLFSLFLLFLLFILNYYVDSPNLTNPSKIFSILIWLIYLPRLLQCNPY